MGILFALLGLWSGLAAVQNTRPTENKTSGLCWHGLNVKGKTSEKSVSRSTTEIFCLCYKTIQNNIHMPPKCSSSETTLHQLDSLIHEVKCTSVEVMSEEL